MAGHLTYGNIPPVYREIHKIVCPNEEQRVDKEIFIQLLMKSNLPKQTLSQIWDSIDSKKEGSISKEGLFKALALIALAQQGKPFTEKALESFIDTELPRPALGELSDLKNLSTKMQREQSPTHLGYTYQELVDMDVVHLETIPDKKGFLVKHVEYIVKSHRHRSAVERRYNDFLAFHECLMLRFPYRMVPRLPPKTATLMGGSKEFVEARRKSLQRFLTLIVRHPSLYDDTLVVFFLTYKGSDAGQKIKDQFRGTPDEFMTSRLAGIAKDLVPADIQTSFQASKDQIRGMNNSIERIKEISDKMTERTLNMSKDMLYFAKVLNDLGSESAAASAWASDSGSLWGHLKHGFKILTGHFSALSERATKLCVDQDEGAGDYLGMFVDITAAHMDLCERHEKGLQRDRQSALSKMREIKRRHMTAQVRAGDQHANVNQLENRITEQETEIHNMENRNYFSLHCIHMETQLVYANLEIVLKALQAMVTVESAGNKELGLIWDEMKPAVNSIIPKEQLSPPTSPVNSPPPMF